ncbi:hypothetical protein Poli38472_013210 [Pythium oligandrum]|uniref:50S ribosomal protein L35 n=1 Tax=Pythium oligandrum TaxID=41045 RepID=A0A8K1FBZ5_PYTOL|nr:hypothetical protein Poli38472_013210 [Pythium oligandrum]|eukprot:TMW55319.1 hypothetical protein Poli38472_013210 [Pythium oligandrum]
MAMLRSLTRQFAGLAVAQTPRVAATAARAPVRTFPGLMASRATPLMPSTLCFNAFPQLQVREMGYKLKSKSSVKKRFKVNCNGLVKRAQANKRHIATKKTRERIRRLGKPVFLEGEIRKNVLKMLPGRK